MMTQFACFSCYARRILILLVAVLLQFSVIVTAYCEALPVNPMWEDLTRKLDEASEGFVLLCPFEISGSGCPKEPTPYIVDSTLDLVCLGQSSTSDECLIECPTTHFVVKELGALLFESITIRSAEVTPIQVESKGFFSAQGCIFDSNHGSLNDEGGGAIRGSVNSNITIQTSSFENNFASNGGAVHTLGALTIGGSRFNNNSAVNYGGAIFTGSASPSLSFTWNNLESNRAGIQGPAIYIDLLDNSGEQPQFSFKSNYACGNFIGNNGKKMRYCDGIVWNRTQCSTFSDTCNLPTATPTTSPTKKPISTPTSQDPTKSPTLRPSQDPTTSPMQPIEPSQSPRIMVTPTPTTGSYTTSPSQQVVVTPTPSISGTTNIPYQTPSTTVSTNKPTFWLPDDIFNRTSPTDSPSMTRMDIPSPLPSTATPSILPSSAPSVSPTSVPSVIPSIVPSSAPSMVPTALPSRLPSSMPSSVPTVLPSILPSASPSGSPSTSPSLVPSALPTLIPTGLPSTVAPSNIPTGWPTLQPSVSSAPTTSTWPTFSPSVSYRPSLRPSTTPMPSEPPVPSPTFSWVESIGDILNSTFQNNTTNSTTIP